MQNILIVTTGLPRSGKTTWCLQQAYPIVNPDAIRLALHGQRFVESAERLVWAAAHLMVESLFMVGHGIVILDATSITRKRRDEWQSDKWETWFKVFDTSKEECLRRADAIGDEIIKPVIERMATAFESLDGYEKIWTKF